MGDDMLPGIEIIQLFQPDDNHSGARQPPLCLRFIPARAGNTISEPPPGWRPSPGRGKAPVAAGEAMLTSDLSEGNALHEYVHHLQVAMPDLDALFVALHRRRTTDAAGARDPIVVLSDYQKSGVRGRPDRYVDQYFGREYAGPGRLSGPMEVITRALQFALRDGAAPGTSTR